MLAPPDEGAVVVVVVVVVEEEEVAVVVVVVVVDACEWRTKGGFGELLFALSRPLAVPSFFLFSPTSWPSNLILSALSP